MSVVFTIGYEGTDIDRFVKTLQYAGINVLADVRAVTVSRKKNFSKNGLRQRLTEAGITYLHFSALGDPKPGREAAREGRSVDFHRIYGEHLCSADAQSALASLVRIVDVHRTCLMCFERDPKCCHRTIIAKALSYHGFTVFDLFADEPSRYLRYASKLSSSYVGKGSPAAE